MQLSSDHEQKNYTHPKRRARVSTVAPGFSGVLWAWEEYFGMHACLQSAEKLQEKAEKNCLCIYTSVWISQKGSVYFVFCASVCDLPPVSWSDTDSLFSKHTHICCPVIHLCTHAHVAFLDSLSLFRAIKTHIPTHIYLQQTRRVAEGWNRHWI